MIVFGAMTVLARARISGGLWADSTMSYSVRHFFRNGGTNAIIVRVRNGGVAATYTLFGEAGPLMLEDAHIFDLLCIPTFSVDTEVDADHRSALDTDRPSDVVVGTDHLASEWK